MNGCVRPETDLFFDIFLVGLQLQLGREGLLGQEMTLDRSRSLETRIKRKCMSFCDLQHQQHLWSRILLLSVSSFRPAARGFSSGRQGRRLISILDVLCIQVFLQFPAASLREEYVRASFQLASCGNESNRSSSLTWQQTKVNIRVVS